MHIDNKYEDCKPLLDDFVKQHKNKSVIIFEMNVSVKILVSYFHRHDIRIHAIVDVNPEKFGQEFSGEVVRDPQEVLSMGIPENSVIVVSSRSDTGSIINSIELINPDLKSKIVFLDLFKYLDSDYVLTDKENLSRATLEDIQKENYNMLMWLYDICEANSIRCYLSYGTLLGAVRHSGFIPWDDDIDVSIPFPDYIRLHSILKNEDEYPFESMLNDPEDGLSLSTIAKIKSKKIIAEEGNFPLRIEDYLKIDIWPMGGYPVDPEESFKYYEDLHRLGDEWKEKVVIPFGTKEFSIETYINLRNKLAGAMGMYEYDAAEYVGEVYCERLYHIRHDTKRRGLNRKLFDITTEAKFEDRIIKIPSGYDEILRFKYPGDYMEIPEESKQRTHNFARSACFVQKNEYYDRDTNYWNKYYGTKKIGEPSLFAQYCLKYMKKGETLIDLGCGSGRDSVFFSQNGLNVVAIDASKVALDKIEEYDTSGQIKCVCGDFVTWMKKKESFFSYCYSRFTLHALNEFQQENLLKNTYSSLKEGGYLFVETRSINDPIFDKGECVGHNAYVYNDHYRRFSDINELTEQIKVFGFRIIEAVEDRGFAPFGDDDPPIIRIIACK